MSLNSQFTSSSELLNDPGFGSLQSFLVKKTGMTYYLDKKPDLAIKLQTQIANRFSGCSEYLSHLESDTGKLELERLISKLTIGETFFFRHEPQWEIVRNRALPEIVDHNQNSKELRIWSAGCSIGAEPYTMAILLDQFLGLNKENWQLKLVATDINRGFLASAKEGIYSDWALRSSSDLFRSQHFEPVDNQWQISPRYREMVKFQHHNLVSDAHAPLEVTMGGGQCDLIVCRNVMIYFDRPTIKNIAQTFFEALRPGGWLLVGPSESDLELFNAFKLLTDPGASIYRKEILTPEGQTLKTHSSSIGTTVLPEKLRRSKDIESLVDQKKWEEVLKICEREVQLTQLCPRLHYYRGLSLHQLKRTKKAEEALRKAIYLERYSTPAHYQLGLILSNNNEYEAAGKSFRNALHSLDKSDIKYGLQVTKELIKRATEQLPRS